MYSLQGLRVEQSIGVMVDLVQYGVILLNLVK